MISRMIKRFDKDSRDRENRKLGGSGKPYVNGGKGGLERSGGVRLKMRLPSERF